ncbi:MAG: pseudouridine-5'-phosphate glycosidase [Actinobacteria bacterium]|nr:pseudouridine-5'-phosphate glycosidase [Actinomycetota bacterium]
MTMKINTEVGDALASGGAVVALESTIFSHLGLPSPSNHTALTQCIAAIREAGAIPAITAVLDGVARVGLEESEHERILGPARKVGEREVALAVGQRWPVGATTVSASLLLAARAGIGVFATGGIGGVHRDVHLHGDVSADLGALASHPVVTVCAGAKSFLDLPRTLEHLEMLGVPVLGLACDEFPAFTVHSSGLPIPARVDTVNELASIVRAHREMGRQGGILTCVPVPLEDSLDKSIIDAVIDDALHAANKAKIEGPKVTPFVLGAIAEATKGTSVVANLSLARNNARVAAELAVQLSR